MTTIGESAFEGCPYLASVTIPEGVETLEDATFRDCKALSSINFPTSLLWLKNSVFENCVSLKDITLNENLQTLGWLCFAGCKGFRSVVIPNSVTRIFQDCFQECSFMETLTLGSGIEWIEQRAFANCRSLVDVYCHAAMVPEVFENTFIGSYISYTVLHVPASAVENYRTAYYWKDFGRIDAIGETTIRGIKADMGAEDSPYYSLDGMRVAQPGKGLYIKDGRKVIVK